MTLVTLSCLLGVVMFALYADCDPVQFGLISKQDQVCINVYNIVVYKNRAIRKSYGDSIELKILKFSNGSYLLWEATTPEP